MGIEDLIAANLCATRSKKPEPPADNSTRSSKKPRVTQVVASSTTRSNIRFAAASPPSLGCTTPSKHSTPTGFTQGRPEFAASARSRPCSRVRTPQRPFAQPTSMRISSGLPMLASRALTISSFRFSRESTKQQKSNSASPPSSFNTQVHRNPGRCRRSGPAVDPRRYQASGTQRCTPPRTRAVPPAWQCRRRPARRQWDRYTKAC